MIITLYRPGEDGLNRYYSLHDRQPLLTARYALTVAWRTGHGKEREKIYGFDTLAEMDRKIRQLFGRRIRAGYRLLYSFARDRPDAVPTDNDELAAARSVHAIGNRA